MAKKTVKRRVTKRAPKVVVAQNESALADVLGRIADKAPVRHQETADARSGVLGTLAEVFISQNAAITAVAEAAVGAPNYNDTVNRG